MQAGAGEHGALSEGADNGLGQEVAGAVFIQPGPVIGNMERPELGGDFAAGEEFVRQAVALCGVE